MVILNSSSHKRYLEPSGYFPDKNVWLSYENLIFQLRLTEDSSFDYSVGNEYLKAINEY